MLEPKETHKLFAAQGLKIMLDLHGLSVKEVKNCLEVHFLKMQTHNLGEFYLITGRGNHLNSNGSRGVLKKVLPKLLKPYCQSIIKINEEAGAYKIILKPQQALSGLQHVLTELMATEAEQIAYAKMLNQHAENNDIEAMLALGVIHLYRVIEGFDNLNEGLALLLRAKQLGSLEAEVQLGVLYHEGLIVKQDHKKAFKHFRYAANKGHPTAQYWLAVCYLHGKGIKYNDELAVKWMKTAADQGDVYAQDSVGDFYLLGKITQKNEKLGIKYKTQAAEQGFSEAQIDLARCYATGYGVNQNDKTAFNWYLSAARFKKPYALYQVGTYLLDGRAGLAPNAHEAFGWFLEAAELGDGDAQAQVANQYLFDFVGTGIEQSIEKGVAWTMKAVEQNNRFGYYVQANAHLKGVGFKQDSVKACELMRIAAEAGCVFAQCELGLLLMGKTPSDLAQDFDTGLQWLKKAAEQGDSEANRALHEISKENRTGSIKRATESVASNGYDPTFFSAASAERQGRAIPIIDAVVKNDLQKVKTLIGVNTNINVNVPGGGKTPLHIAIELGYADMACLLVASKADVNARTQKGITPLHVAAQNNQVFLMTLLMNEGSKINACSDVGCTPLHEAAAKGHQEAVCVLLEKAANPNIRETRYQLTASNLANENRHHQVRDQLISAMNYEQNFMANVRYILFNWQRTLPVNSVAWNYINTLSITIQQVNNADEVFKKISAAFKDTASPIYSSIKETLSVIRKELIANMKQYNADKINALQTRQNLGTSEKEKKETNTDLPSVTFSQKM